MLIPPFFSIYFVTMRRSLPLLLLSAPLMSYVVCGFATTISGPLLHGFCSSLTPPPLAFIWVNSMLAIPFFTASLGQSPDGYRLVMEFRYLSGLWRANAKAFLVSKLAFLLALQRGTFAVFSVRFCKTRSQLLRANWY